MHLNKSIEEHPSGVFLAAVLSLKFYVDSYKWCEAPSMPHPRHMTDLSTFASDNFEVLLHKQTDASDSLILPVNRQPQDSMFVIVSFSFISNNILSF